MAIKRLENGDLEWTCPQCEGGKRIIGEWEANVIQHSKLETQYICEKCNGKKK